MTEAGFVIVKLSAAGDVLLTTALARELRRMQPRASCVWLTSDYAAPLLQGNPDLDAVFTLPLGRPRAAAGVWRAFQRLRTWRRRHPGAVALLAHRSRRLRLLLRAAGFTNLVGWSSGERDTWGLTRAVPYAHDRHRLQAQADLLRAAGLEVGSWARMAPRLDLNWDELATGEQVWRPDECGPRWVLAPGGAANPLSAMPNRRWPRERFLELARRAQDAGVAVRCLGGPDDAALCSWLCAALADGARCQWAGKLTLRHTAAALAAADLVIGNDSLPLIMAHALGRPALGLYGPTAAAIIHAPGQPYLQGRAGCGPGYDPRLGTRGVAYTCPRARCMEQISTDAVWRLAAAHLPHTAAHAG
ncbi:MAG TPA: glycosyltransferase family 9 protein [Terriglobales bacterium]|nr:glycosyltransferase family 9 protein [Terriglobales bacterium]